MAKYQIWDKVSPIYTPGADRNGKAKFTAEEWIAKYPWIEIDDAKMVISGGKINGALALDFDWFKDNAMKIGVVITDDMTDNEILYAVEAKEREIEEATATALTVPTAEERQAAALEAIASGQTSESTAVMNALLGEEE